MRVKTLVLIAASLMVLSSCACKPQIEYVDRVVLVDPILPEVESTPLPQTELIVWGDYRAYKAECEAQISKCNADKQGLIDAIQTGKQEPNDSRP